MDQEKVFDSEKFVSSRRASEITGYAQDYIGQLARGSQIAARRIGGLWYVSIESLTAYKSKPNDAPDDASVQDPSDGDVQTDTDVFVDVDGKEYVSANRASKISGYNQDYVGQLARGSKIVSRQIGNRWYVDKESLMAHKKEKDALLAAVQAQAVGIRESAPEMEKDKDKIADEQPLLVYSSDGEADLMPWPLESGNDAPVEGSGDLLEDETTFVPIRRIGRENEAHITVSGRHLGRQWTDLLEASAEDAHYSQSGQQKMHARESVKTIHKAIFPVVATATGIILVIGFVFFSLLPSNGLVSGFKTTQNQKTVAVEANKEGLVANSLGAFDGILTFVENMVTRELNYKRNP